MTAKPVELAQEAAIEAREAHGWYLARSGEVAARFRAGLGRAQTQLANHPESAPVWDGFATTVPVRKLVLPGFPFCLFYVDRGDRLRVLAIAHTSRRPGYWLDRE